MSFSGYDTFKVIKKYKGDIDNYSLTNLYMPLIGVDSYSIVTEKTLNSVANGMLSCGDAIYYVLSNIFEFGDNLKYNTEQKQLDIEQYGLWEFSEAQYATQATYDALNLKYIKNKAINNIKT